jgi:hypothetical protein
MGKRLAVLVGVPYYEHLNNLPACEHDVHAMASLLKESGRFDDVRALDTGLAGAQCRVGFETFFRDHRDADVDELIVFLSGHGSLIDDSFHFLWRDFSEEKPKSTSISNDELDELARGLNPALFCKIVDACNSGVGYVKDPQWMEAELKKGMSGFKTCYFFFSSQTDQSSFAQVDLSNFTRAVIRAVVNHPAKTLTYNALASAAADAFANRREQTPHFVHQAKLTEVFLELDDEIRDSMRKIVMPTAEKAEDQGTANGLHSIRTSLETAITRDAKRYLQRDATERFLSELQVSLTNRPLRSDLSDYFELSTDAVPHHGLSLGLDVAQWLDKRPSDQYFAQIRAESRYEDILGNEVSREEAVKAKNPLFGLGGLASTVRKRRILQDFYRTEGAEWDGIVSIAAPRYPNLPKITFQVTYVIGLTQVVMFGAVQRATRTGWNEFGHPQRLKDVTLELGAEEQSVEKTTEALFALFEGELDNELLAFARGPEGAGDSTR